MRLIKELCAERKLSAIINIHDVMLAQMFAERIVGLQLGEIVYDGPPNNLTADVLTKSTAGGLVGHHPQGRRRGS